MTQFVRSLRPLNTSDQLTLTLGFLVTTRPTFRCTARHFHPLSHMSHIEKVSPIFINRFLVVTLRNTFFDPKRT